MTDINPKDVLFVGHARSVQCWYRAALPAMALRCHWVGMAPWTTEWPPIVAGSTLSLTPARLADHKVVFLQLARGRWWRDQVKRLRRFGVKVVYEIDDYIHGVLGAHEAEQFFDARRIADHEMVMEVCDAIVTPTPWLTDQYHLNLGPRAFTCRTGLDLSSPRYAVTRPRRSGVNVGWAGSVGHREALTPWLDAVRSVMHEHDHVRFTTIGTPFADELAREFPGRTLAVPFTTVENFPAALCALDVGLAPGDGSLFFRGKSDLRFLEYGAVGVPGIYDMRVYPDAALCGQNVVTTHDPYDNLLRLVEDEEAREWSGEKAREYVGRERDVARTSEDWIRVIEEVTD